MVHFKDNWLILVGYPLDQDFSPERCDQLVRVTSERFRPEYLWFIGPEIPPSLSRSPTERESDEYFVLDIESTKVKPSLHRIAQKASGELDVETAHSLSKEHEALIKEFFRREKPSPRIRELYLAMPEYLAYSKSSCVLNARNKRGRLCAFYVVDLAAGGFTTYVLGTYSKKNNVPHASDLLFLEMIELTREHGKNIIHLGLGVNEGIRRFKKKWGGVVFLPYAFCLYEPSRREGMDSLLQKL